MESNSMVLLIGHLTQFSSPNKETNESFAYHKIQLPKSFHKDVNINGCYDFIIIWNARKQK